MGFKSKLKGVKDKAKFKAKQIKASWSIIEPTIKAKHFKFIINKIVLKHKGKELINDVNIKATCIKYKNRVGIHLVIGELPVRYKIIQKTGSIRELNGLSKHIDFINDSCNYYLIIGDEKIIFDGCVCNLIFYKKRLVEVDLPFSDNGEYVNKSGVIVR